MARSLLPRMQTLATLPSARKLSLILDLLALSGTVEATGSSHLYATDRWP